jgi:hypothetical protein
LFFAIKILAGKKSSARGNGMARDWQVVRNTTEAPLTGDWFLKSIVPIN